MGFYYKFKAWYRQRHPSAFATALPERLLDGRLVTYIDMCLVLMGLADRFGCRCGQDGVVLILSMIYGAMRDCRSPAVVLFWDESEYVTLGKVETQEERDEKTRRRYSEADVAQFEERYGGAQIGALEPLPLPWDLFMRDRDRRRRSFRWFADQVRERLHVPDGQSVVFDRPPGFDHPIRVTSGGRVEPFRSGYNPRIGESDFKPFYYLHYVFPNSNALIYSIDADTIAIALLETPYRLRQCNELRNEVWIKSLDQEKQLELEDPEELRHVEESGYAHLVRLEEDLKRTEEPAGDPYAPENAYKRKFFVYRHQEFIDCNELWRARLAAYPSDRASFLASEVFVIFLTGNDMSGSSHLGGVGEMFLFELWDRHWDQLGPLLRVDTAMYLADNGMLPPDRMPVFRLEAAWKLVRLAYQQKLKSRIQPPARRDSDRLLPYEELRALGPLKFGRAVIPLPSVDQVRMLFARTLYAFAYYSLGWRGSDAEPNVLSVDARGRSLMGWALVRPDEPPARSNVRVVRPEELSDELIERSGHSEPAAVRFCKPFEKQFDAAENNPFSGIKRPRSSGNS